MAQWMMRADVRRALHVEESPAKEWPTPQVGFDYTMNYAACNPEYPPGTPSMIDFYRDIAPQLDTTVIYNGDTDPCVSYEGTRTAISRVGFAELDGGGYRPWFFNHSAASIGVIQEKAALFGPDLNPRAAGPQFGGEVVNYEHNMHFVTFHGSGHMVPSFRPQAALHFLRKVVQLRPLSPLLPTNATLLAMSDKEFAHVLDMWTERAKAAPYVENGPSVNGQIGDVWEEPDVAVLDSALLS
jgi:serine carboxypeptidase-like clade 1